MSYTTKNYAAHGGNEWVIGGKLTVLEGAVVTGVTATVAAATGSVLGGVKAEAKGAGDTIVAKIGDDDKLYVAPYTLPAAAADALGGVNLTENQADSTAATIAALKDDFNGLLAKLKTAGVMAADAPAE